MDLHLKSGTCYALFVYEVGRSIDLDECERRIKALTQRATLKRKRRAPQYFDYRPAPLRVIQETDPVTLGACRSAAHVDAVVYDFGAVSLTYSFPLAGPLSDLVTLSAALYDNSLLLADSRRHIDRLLAALGPAVVRAHVADSVESYTIFHIDEFATPCPAHALRTRYAQDVARILRSEREELSEQEVSDALACHISFSSGDVTIIDWDAAIVFDREPEDVLAVLEFANAELLEMRYLDQQLDDALDQAYQALTRRTWRRLRVPGSSRSDLRHVARLQVDAAILFEAVNNTLKLLGDQFLARVYRLASQRFHLTEWDASILRKLDTLDSIYGKMSDVAASRRLEVLEWIIILLIAAEIVVPLLPWPSVK